MKRGKKVKKINPINPPKKSYNLNKRTIITFAIVILTLIFLFLLFKNLALTTKVIETPPTPENCSNESIKKAWEFIFKGSSENLTIFAPTTNYSNETNYSEYELLEAFNFSGCPVYSIYQVNGTNIKAIVGVDTWFFVSMKMIYAINGDFKPEKIENITSSLKDTSEVFTEILSSSIMDFEGDNTSLIPRNITSIEQAKSQFESVFKISSSNWTSESSELEYPNLTLYIFNESKEMENMTLFGESIDPIGERIKMGVIFGNSSLDQYIYTEMSLLSILEPLSKQFENWTSPINTSLNNVTIEINNSRLKMSEELDIFSEPRSEIQKVEILQNNKTIIETEINFTEESFDWTKIILKKQEFNSSRGYVIINGLNYTKNVTIDRLNNKSKEVCVKDKEINSIGEISATCNLADEYLLECPGNLTINSTNLTCKIYLDKFVVTGLKHSAVIEMSPPEEPCIQNWTCTDWTDLAKECGYRECSDLNNCNNESTRPLEYKTCPICIPDWECTEFLPEKCPKSEKRTRTCTDLNNCGREGSMPDTTQNCEKKSAWIWILLSTVFGIAIIFLLIITLLKNKYKFKDESVKEHPKVQNEIYKQHPNHPSKKEQSHASNQTGVFRNQQNPTNNPNKNNDEYYYPEGYK
jgi:hypothetical protein